MLRVGIAGYGWWGRYLAARLGRHDGFAVIAVADPDAAARQAADRDGLAVCARFEELIADPGIDAVILTTPHMHHEEQVCAAAAAGRHVFCEKPLGLTAASARRAVDACARAGVVLGIGHERRFEPAMGRLKAMLERGDLGTVLHVEAAFSHDKLAGIAPGGWRTSRALSPGAGMTGMGVHLTDLMLWMFGPVATVQALTRDRVLGWPTGDMVVAQLGFEAGMTGHLSALLATPHFMRFHVFGAAGWVEIRNATHPDTPGGVTHWTWCAAGAEPQHAALDWSDAVRANLEAFAAAVAGRARYPWSDEDLVGNIAVFEAIVRAAGTGGTERPGALSRDAHHEAGGEQ